jgi:uncharacterized protein
MDVTPQIPADRQLIQGYGDGGFRITGARHEGSVLVLPGRTHAWPVRRLSEATRASLEPLIESRAVDLLLVGCGGGIQPLPPGLRQELRAAGMVVELMDTGAACRTYNVLLAEERRVAAALIAI